MLKYLSIDCETTGINWDICSMLELCAVFETDWVTPIEELPCWHCIVRHTQLRGEPFGLAMNAELLRMIDKPENYPDVRFLWPAQVLPELKKWIIEQGLDPMHVNASGKNFAGFDKNYIRKIDGGNNIIKFRYRSLDPGQNYLRPDDEFIPGMEECCRRAGIDPKVEHRADSDARKVILLNRIHYKNLWGMAT